MQWFLDLGIRNKLLLGFGLMIACLAAVLATAYVTISELHESRRSLAEHDLALIEEMGVLRANESLMRLRMLEMQLSPDRAGRQRFENLREAQAIAMENSLSRLAALAQAEPALAERIENIRAIVSAFLETQLEQVALINAGRVEQAAALAAGVQSERFERIRELSLELDGLVRERMREDIRAIERQGLVTMMVFGATGFIAVLLAVTLAAFLNRLIAGPLGELASRAGRIAEGEMATAPRLLPRADELGVLEDKFNAMALALRDKVEVAERIAGGDLAVKVAPRSGRDVLGKAFVAMVAGLRAILGQIEEGVEVLANATRDILEGTAQAASASAETASAISQTSATLEQIKQTAQVSATRARQVSDSAQRTAEVSLSGRRAVEESVQAMLRIREQIASITESMGRLSEQGQAIGDVIATVNDLAEQSNILAVNAAIEAAKAGEQGKGFAVVAQEVRELAEQSKQATAQVRSILADTQKATGAAVSATEQAGRAVDSGVKLSSSAGEAIRALTDSIGEAAGAASQIAVSAQQQLMGMDQAVLAIQSIREASGQNVESTRQAERAAQRLHELGQSLKEAVKAYRM